MHLVHDPESDGDPRTLAGTVESAETTLARARGLMFRRSIPDDYALAFRFPDAAARSVHMLFVPFPIDVIWTTAGAAERVERLSPWTGLARSRADVLYELPAGAAAGVSPGDDVRLVD